MASAFADCDRAGLPAYLESTNPRNMTLNQRHGFKAIGQIQVGTSPPMVPMLPPGASSGVAVELAAESGFVQAKGNR